jgi:hypothetical protein
VLASKSDGAKLWEEEGGQGVDDVWAADLNGDGLDETIIGYNGNSGLHVFSSEGKRLWKRTELGNVWHVAAGDLDGDGMVEVISTSARGKVHVFDPKDGGPRPTLDARIYANMIRIAPKRAFAGANGDVALVVGNAAGGGEAMVALQGDGKVLWTLELPGKGGAHCDSLAVAPDGTKAAVGLRGGVVCVVDLIHGKVVASAPDQGMTPMAAWASSPKDGEPLLLVATGRSVNAYRIKAGGITPKN